MNKKVHWQLKRLESWLNPDASRAEEEYERGKELNLDQVNISLITIEKGL